MSLFQGMSARLSDILVCSVLAVGIVASYSTSLEGAFVFDDFRAITENPAVRTLYAPSSGANRERPLAVWTFAVNYALGGLDTFGYHVVNILIHWANACLVFLLLRQLGPRIPGADGSAEWTQMFAAATALLWALHPLNTQAVTYIVQRMESLASMFMLIACLATTYLRHSFWAAFVIILLASAAASLSKPIAIVLPALVFLVDYTCRRAEAEETRRPFAISVLITAAVLLASFLPINGYLLRSVGFSVKSISSSRQEAGEEERRIVGGRRQQEVADTRVNNNSIAASEREDRGPASEAQPKLLFARDVKKKPTSWEYLRTQPEIILHYVRLVFCPVGLTLDYFWPVQDSLVVSLALGALIVGWIAIGLRLLIRAPFYGLLTLWPLVILAPTSSIVPIADLAFEHRMYLPSVGIIALVCHLATRAVATGRLSSTLVSGTLGVVAIVFGLLTAQRNLDYHSETQMWLDAAEKCPTNARALNNAASCLIANRNLLAEEKQVWENDLRLARLLLEKAQTCRMPEDLQLLVLYNTAYTSFLSNDLEQAETAAREALNMSEDRSHIPHFILGVVAGREGRFEEAIEHLSRSIEIDDTQDQPLLFRGRAYGAVGDLNRAASNFSRAATLSPSDPEILNELAVAHMQLQDYREAARAFTDVLRLSKRFPLARERRALCLGELGQVQAATFELKELVREDPENQRNWIVLIEYLSASGQTSLAEKVANEFAMRTGQSPETLWNQLNETSE